MRRPLGRGIEALIPGAARPSTMPPADAGPSDREVPIELVRPNPRQPRTRFDDAALAELVESIRSQGVIQPLLVRPGSGGGYELIAGERRLRAAERAGLATVPVVVREASDTESLELAIVENVQRDDLSPLEEAVAYERLMDEFGLTQEQVAERVGKSRPTIANALRLLRLPDPIKDDLARGRLTAGHARALVAIDDPEAQLRAARQIVARKLSVRDTEQLTTTARPRTGAAAPAKDVHRQALERELSTALGTRVRVVPRGKGGRIEIEYYSNAELQGLTERLAKRPLDF